MGRVGPPFLGPTRSRSQPCRNQLNIPHTDGASIHTTSIYLRPWTARNLDSQTRSDVSLLNESSSPRASPTKKLPLWTHTRASHSASGPCVRGERPKSALRKTLCPPSKRRATHPRYTLGTSTKRPKTMVGNLVAVSHPYMRVEDQVEAVPYPFFKQPL